MKSLHRRGQDTPAARMSCRNLKSPWKNFESVSTLRQAAPPASYALAICRHRRRKSYQTPDGTEQPICNDMNSEPLQCRHPYAIARRNSVLSAVQRSQVEWNLKPRTPSRRLWQLPPWCFPLTSLRHMHPQGQPQPASYLHASEMLLTLTWSKSGWMTPLLGDAFLTSAMRPGFPVRVCAAVSAPMKSRDFGAAPTRAISWGRETLCLHRSTSTALNLQQQPERLSAQAEHPHSLSYDFGQR